MFIVFNYFSYYPLLFNHLFDTYLKRIAGFLVKKTSALRLFYFSTFSVDNYGDYFWLNSASPKKTLATK